MSSAVDQVESDQDLRQSNDHIVDSINLLIFTFLLILVILTIWLFKHKRIPYVHETGLAIIYGAIFGIIIRYGFKPTNKKILSVTRSDLRVKDVPEYVYLTVGNVSTQQTFIYEYKIPWRSKEDKFEDYEEKASFDPEIFFNILLPPIIFNAGYSMKKKHFFKNFGAILVFALVGTSISCFVTGGLMYLFTWVFGSIRQYFSFADCLFFGAIISATDPITTLAIFHDQKVNVNLYALVFGESVLNDAVSITLAQAIERYSSGTSNATHFDLHKFFKGIYTISTVFLSSFAIGSSMSCFNALLTKFTYIRHYPNLETALFILMSYSTFLASEALGLTGIVSVLFNGVFQAHYTYNNLSKESQTQTKEIFSLLNFLSENFIFIYIGITLFTFHGHKWEVSFIIFSLIAITVARALSIYPLSFLINLSRSKKNKIDKKMQHLLLFSGLRGAMAFALAIRNTSSSARRLILTTTSMIVVITVIICGGFTNNMLAILGFRSNNQTEEEPDAIEMTEDVNDSRKKPKTGILAFISNKFGVFKAWHSFDKSFMKPLLTHHVPSLTETMPNCCLPITKLLTSREQERLENASVYPFTPLENNSNLLNHMNSTNSMFNPFEHSELQIQNLEANA